MDTLSMSNTMSKGSVYESDSIYKAYLDDAESRLADGVRPKAISNEEIHKGDEILQIYRVEDDAIHGGMGSVWRVHHQSWNTDLAMKRPQPRFFAEAGEGRKEEFIAECEHWINLGLHPNIVSCYYVREIGGVPTIFSEWMDGGSLKDAIQSGRLYEGTEVQVQERILDIAIQTARGLQYSHEKGLIHQDVKPGNILLTKAWDAKVADFGLAKAQSRLTDGERPASSGYTLQYCPKEQAEGAPAEKWMDVYAWALTVLEMYAGKRLWETGAEAAKPGADDFNGCRIPIPEAAREQFLCCLAGRQASFDGIESSLAQAYQQLNGAAYPRPISRAPSETAGTLNNRALSYLDLGMDAEAGQMLKETIKQDGSVFLYHYNDALFRWSKREISDAMFVSCLNANRDASELCVRVMNTVTQMRGFWDSGKEEYTYPTTKERPDTLEALLPLSQTSVDKNYQVIGYIEKDKYGIERFGYRIKDLRSGEVKDFPNDYEDYGVSTSHDGFTYMHPHYYKSDHVRFAGPHSEIIVMAADVLWFFDAKSGCLLLSLPPVTDEDGDTWNYEVLGYTESGVIEYVNSEPRWKRWTVHAIRLQPDKDLSYKLAEITTVNARLTAERNMKKYYEEAISCWDRNDVCGTYHVLNKSLTDHVLTLHEPSLRLWSKLSAYYKKARLITVLPTTDDPTPIPARFERWKERQFSILEENKNRADNGQTEILLDCIEEDEFDSCNDMYEYTFYYSITATDKQSRKNYFKVSNLEIASEADWQQFSKDRYLGLKEEYKLWYAREYGREEIIDLKELSINKGKFKEGESRVRFSLPGGYYLKNTAKGVDIGGFVFDDVFTDFRPLWASDVIACRDHNYRLVYQYLID